MQRSHFAHVLVATSCALALQACASTMFTSTWTAPGVTRLVPADKKIAAVVMVADQAVRRSAEDTLAGELKALGAQGVAAYTILSDEQRADEQTAKAALDAAGVQGVVVLRPVATNQSISVVPSYPVEPYYRSMWRGGYWSYGWRGAWTAPEVRTDTIVSVETLVYSVSSDTLIWAGHSETQNPDRVNAFVKEVITAAVREMKKAGLL